MIEFRMPSLGSDMDEGKLLKWLVQPGDTVHKGQVIAVVDTSKAAIDVECWSDGVVHALLVEPETVIPVGTPMAVLRAQGERIEEWNPQAAIPTKVSAPATAPQPAPISAPVAAPAAAPSAPAAGARQRVSPAARRRAQELGVDVESVRGSGPDGAITLADVEARKASASRAASSQPAAVPSAVIAPVAAPVTAAVTAKASAAPAPPSAVSRAHEMRKVIAAAMARSKREIPHYYLAEDILFANAARWLAQRNADLPVTQRLLPAALLVKAVAVALHRYPEFNGFWRDGGFNAGAGVHPGIAISLREGGLVAPALRDAAALDIAALTRALLDLVKRTRAGSLRSSELNEATITITNLGEQGVASVFGVIYPPQVALVGFGRVMLRPWVADGGGEAGAADVKALPVVTASLAADHRASDGHRGALLLAQIRELLQDPQALDAPLPTPELP